MAHVLIFKVENCIIFYIVLYTQNCIIFCHVCKILKRENTNWISCADTLHFKDSGVKGKRNYFSVNPGTFNYLAI